MSVQFELAAQTMLYTALNGNISATVFDAVPHLPAGMPNADFPYVVIDDCNADPFDNDTDLGQIVHSTLHVWSRAEGMLETKTILGEIYAILHRGTFVLAGYSLLDSLYEDSLTMLDEDGETRHGVARYRLTIQEA
jgi:hypothetical protein